MKIFRTFYHKNNNSLFEQLKQQFKTMLQQLKTITNHPKKPWYLIVGTPLAGKNTLLKHAGFELILPKYNYFWTNQTVHLLDLTLPHFDSEQINNLLKCLRQNHCQLSGILVITGMPDILMTQPSANLFRDLKQQLLHIQSQLRTKLPVSFVINKTDLLAGFAEYFSDLGQEERQQSWGVTLPFFSTDMLIQKLTALLNRLNERLLWRLHQERNPHKRVLIKNFPLQMESLLIPLSRWMEQLFQGPEALTKLFLHGVYFVSSTQDGQTINRLTSPLQQAFAVTTYHHELVSIEKAQKMHCYFVQNLFDVIHTPEDKSALDRTRKIIWITASVLAGSIFCGTAIFWLQHFKQHVQETHRVASELTQYMTGQPAGRPYMIDSLTILQKAIPKHSSNNQKLFAATQALYLQSLEKQLRPFLVDFIATQLHNTATSNITELYNTLKIYLMLTNPQHVQSSEVLAWVQEHAADLALSDEQLKVLLGHLAILLKHWIANRCHPAACPQDPVSKSLIEQTRERLLTQNPAALALALIEQDLQMNKNLTKFGPLTIPTLFTQSAYETVITKHIPTAVKQVLTGNWVLGKRELKSPTQTELTQQVGSLYKQQYTNTWQTKLNQITFQPFSTVKQAIVMLDHLAIRNAPWIKLLNTAHQQMRSSQDPQDYTGTLQKIAQLKYYLQAIQHAQQPSKAAFEMAQARIQQTLPQDPIRELLTHAEQQPAPLKNWLTSLAHHTWALTLQLAHDHISTLWQNKIVYEYRQNIENRYPIYKEATTDITLENFEHFFAPGGTLDSFFNDYLKPFVDTTGPNWTWKMVDGQRLTASETTLPMLKRAAIIQKMFFPENTPTISASFTLKPVNLGHFAIHFSIKQGNQKFTFDPEARKEHLIHWPKADSTHPNSGVTLSFIRLDNEPITATTSGPWAWLKIVEQSLVDRNTSLKSLFLTFNVQGHTAEYELISENAINPFLPNIMDQFRNPAEI